jgi:hypothetical protein
MLFLKYICAVIALFSSVTFITTLISDITMSPAMKAIQLNTTENEVIKKSSSIRLWLTLLMAITWSVLIVF